MRIALAGLLRLIFSPDAIHEQTSISIDYSQLINGITQNFNVPGGLQGLSIASPSTNNPNYYFHWVRDGALNIDALIEHYYQSPSTAVAATINSYLESSKHLQKVPNMSGNVGEPKFYIDGTAFNGPWGRPQNDGPALRAMAAAKWLKGKADDEIKHQYNDFIRQDLDYVARVWALPSFDLWEELYGYHFFTSVAQYGAMKSGALIAGMATANDDAERFTRIADEIVDFISSNYLPGRFAQGTHINEHFPSGLADRNGLDAASVLAVLELESLAGWTVAVDGKPLAFNVSHSAVQATIEGLLSDMTQRYPINHGRPGGIGRYPEDVYDGNGRSNGNPWFICTAAVAEALTRLGQPQRAEPLLKFILAHKGATLSEQMDRTTGYMRGAANLTWSYCAVLRAFKTYNAVASTVAGTVA